MDGRETKKAKIRVTVKNRIQLIIVLLIIIAGIAFHFTFSKRIYRPIEVCYAPDGVNITEKKIVGGYWGGSSGVMMDDDSVVLGGLDFSDRKGIKDEQTGNSLKDVSFLKSSDGWNFSKFRPNINNLSETISACGDPTIIKLPEGGYRMYFTDGEKGCHSDAPLMSAYSKDGYSYSFEGKLTGNPGINLKAVDFTVLYEKNARKYYIYTRAENFDEVDILETTDGRHISKRYKIKIPFSLQFSILDQGDHYVAYGGHVPSDKNELDSDLRYPVKATSRDGLNWERTQDQPNGPWTGNKTYCNTYAVLKLSDGYYFY